MIVIIDYGMGNLTSVHNALQSIAVQSCISNRAQDIASASALILPGVGAFGDGMKQLHQLNLIEILKEQVLTMKKPLLGICLGMQLITDGSEEFGNTTGLQWIEGNVKKLSPLSSEYKIPHIGWNDTKILTDSKLLRNLSEKPVFYFVHSYAVTLTPSSAAVETSICDHGCRITASLEQDNIFATQFHPEKSQREGIQLLKNFAAIAREYDA